MKLILTLVAIATFTAPASAYMTCNPGDYNCERQNMHEMQQQQQDS